MFMDRTLYKVFFHMHLLMPLSIRAEIQFHDDIASKTAIDGQFTVCAVER